MNRSCQRHTQGFETPARRITSAVPQSSAVAKMMRALLRTVAIRHHRRQSLAVGGSYLDADPLAHRALSHALPQYGIL
jgi:hypothetical protein